jgi:3-hydroxyacyl-CoA dehydrogenase/enoyl-CoA hydratase/3-hydroxybutyryl-CoA epimerase/3-hydroxyacyl-CoA dehydrogenase/enoyl-CoA hydratase/3-hydroxybutyryl-CoA epimerase/enoyl-CoA isomerase
MGTYFTFEELDGNIGRITFDSPGKKVNTFGRPIVEELEKLVGELEKKNLKGLLFKSGKKDQFIAGADLNELAALSYLPKEMLAQLSSHMHGLLTRVSKLPYPTVCLIDGPSMGGGTEFALSMDYRIASTSPKTQIGLPEVKVGIIPGWGGTQRLPRVIGVHPALEMITSGEPVNAAKAVKIGLAFDAVPLDQMEAVGRSLIEYAHQTGEWKKLREKKEQPVGLTQDQAMFMFAIWQGGIFGKTKGQYPAPLAALDAVREGCNVPLQEGLKVEQAKFAEVGGTSIASSLIGVFFMNNRLQSDTGISDPNIKPRELKRVGVLGAGLMGAGIVTSSARTSIPTVMVDVKDDFVQVGLKRAMDVVGGRIKAGKAKPEDMASMLANITTGTSHRYFSECDIVVEAIPEKEELKKDTYKQLLPLMKPDALLVSNTSTISITRLAAATDRPDRFAGLHFFNPVDRMPLVEVIRGEKTSDETVATLVAFAKKIKKTPIVCKDCPGFLVNRILLPYMNEALLLLCEGAEMDKLDKASERFGMPMGPIALQDLVGIDTSLYAGSVVIEAYKDRAAIPPNILQDLVEAGRLGTKTGKGFRQYTGKKGKAEPDPEFNKFLDKNRIGTRQISGEEMTDRLFLGMLVEATLILEEGIVREPGDVDMGLIMGCGFPPFRGGILRWCDTEGAGKLVAKLEKYSSLGKRFHPSETLKRMASSGEKFYPAPKVTV